MSKRKKQRRETEEKEFWFQLDAFNALYNDLAPKKGFPSAIVAYQAVCAVAAETNSEPGPERDGVPFEITLDRIASMVSQPVQLTLARLRDFERLGLIDALPGALDTSTRFTVRLRQLKARPQ